MNFLAFFYAAFFLLFSPSPSFAACSAPAGNAGDMIYNADWHVPQYCDNTSWIAMGSNSSTAWKMVDAGDRHACGILLSDDSLWCWGGNAQGQLGDNTTTDRYAPTAINGGGTWTQVSAREFNSCGIKTDGTLWCWGDNTNGQIGDNTSGTDRLVPTAVSGGGSWKWVSVGDTFACGIKSDDTVWCWGFNNNGAVGDGTSGTNRLIPTAISGGGAWKQLNAGGWGTTCAIKSDDTLWCWGYNGFGNLGRGSCCTNGLTPAQISGGGTWKQVGVAYNHSCAVKLSDNSMWCWGRGLWSMQGAGSSSDVSTPTSVVGGGTNWKQAFRTEHYGCASKNDDSLWCWGSNFNGQFGNGNKTDSSSPVASGGGAAFKSMSGGYGFACGIKSNDSLWCWGSNANGQLGVSGSTPLNAPTSIANGGAWKQVSQGNLHTCAIKSDDTLWCWGYNGNGQLGDGTSTNRTVPTLVNGGMTWKQVSVGTQMEYTCGINSLDALYCWGRNFYGNTGNGGQFNVPTAVSGGGAWKKVSTSAGATCGIKTDDSLWCWGDNGYGQMGDGTTGGSHTAPQVVPGGFTWGSLGGGDHHVCAIKLSDSSLWCWGNNGSGQIGDNTSGTNRLVPTAINGGGTWKQVSTGGNSHTCGIKTDDTLWCWGWNGYGQIGDNTSGTNRLIPTAINGGGTWKMVSGGYQHSCGVKLSDNTTWCWGGNTNGQLGDGTNTQRLVPTAVSGGGTWLQIEVGFYSTCGIDLVTSAIKCWGSNNYGQLTLASGSVLESLTPLSPNVGGGGGGTCASPTEVEGTIMYNADARLMQFCNGTNWQPMNKGKYTAGGVNLSGGQTSFKYLSRGGDLTGIVDSKAFTLSFWMYRYIGCGSAAPAIYSNQDTRFLVYIDSSNSCKLRIIGKGTGGGATLLDMLSTSVMAPRGWTHVLISVDLNNAANRYIYINGVAETLTVNTYTNNIIDFTRTEHMLGENVTASAPFGYKGGGNPAQIADFWLDIGTYMDISNADVRAKFRDSGGNPVDLGPTGNYPTGTSPEIFFGRTPYPDEWAVNKGTGGAFTLAGGYKLGPSVKSGLPGSWCNRPGGLTTSGTVTFSTASTVGAIWSNENYIFAGRIDGNLNAYTFNGSTFTLAGSIAIADYPESIWGDGTYIYAAGDSNTVKAYTFDGTTFTLAGSIAAFQPNGVHGDGTYIYVINGAGNLEAYTFNGSTFSLAGSIAVTGNQSSVWAGGGYIYVAVTNAGLSAYTFNGTTFTLRGSVAAIGSGCSGYCEGSRSVHGDDTYIYLAEGGAGLKAYTFNGTAFTLRGSTGANGPYNNVWTSPVWNKDKFIYLADEDSFIKAYTFDGTNFTYKGNKESSACCVTGIRRLGGDSEYAYAFDEAGNGRIYALKINSASKGCSCNSPGGGAPGGQEGSILYNSAFNRLQYCNGDWTGGWMSIGK